MTSRRGQNGGAWTDAKVAHLKMLIATTAMSAHQMGKALGGMNRSQVLGKCNRMGLTLPGAALRKAKKCNMLPPKTKRPSLLAPRIPARVSRVPAFVFEPIPGPKVEDVARKALADLESNECRFPVGDPGTKGFGFCASERVPGLPYCAGHAARCYVAKPLKTNSKNTMDVSDTGPGLVRSASELVTAGE
jgi:GcrA cell cycle regulator